MLSSADAAATVVLEVGSEGRRLQPGNYRVVVWSETPQDWEASVQIQIATPRMKEADVWISPDDLLFTANRIASFSGDFHVRAVAQGTPPTDLVIEFVR
jgi:hypothetical protein